MSKFNFGENLRIVRLAKGVSQDAMALALRISQTSYSRIERTPTVPDVSLVEKISETLNVDRLMLITGNGIHDLIPQLSFEQHAKSMLKTNIGLAIYVMFVIPFIEAFSETAYGFCEGFGTSPEVQKHASVIASFVAIIIAVSFARAIRKGKV